MSMYLEMFFTLSLSGAVLILVLLGATRIFGRYMGRRWQYYIWLAAVLRLLLPIPSPAGLFFPDVLRSGLSAGLLSEGGNMPAWTNGLSGGGTMEGQPETGMEGVTGKEEMGAEGTEAPRPDYTGALRADTVPVSSHGLYLVLLILWLSVAAVLMGRKIWNYRYAARLCKRAEISSGMPDMWLEVYGGPLEEACRTCGLNRRPRLAVSRAIPSPVTMGLFAPVIIMPADIPADRAYYAFLHEITHIRRLDALYKWLAEAAVCLHWFNPAVYVLQKEVSRACELSCDEAVIRHMDSRDKQRYGELLLATLRRHTVPSDAGMGLPLSQNAKWMKERLVSILEFRTRSRKWSWAAWAVTAAVISMAVLCGFAPLQRKTGTAGAETVLAGAAGRLETGAADGTSKISWNEYEDVRRRPDQKSLQTKMFWANGYIVALAWNVDPDQYDVVRQADGKTLCFTGKTEPYAEDSSIAVAVQQSIEKQKLSKGKYNFQPDQLVLLGVDGPFEGTADELATWFYEADNLSYFAAVAGSVSSETCAGLMERFYKEDQIKYFAVISGNHDTSLKGRKSEMAKQAAKAGKSDFFSVLEDELTDAEKADIALDAYRADQTDIFYMTYETLSRDQAGEIANQAYEEDRVEYLYVLKDMLTPGQAASLAERARRDGKQELLYVLEWKN